MQIIVLGMHRSGTSAIAGMFQQMGAVFGPLDMALDPHPSNGKGFFERKDVVRLNDLVLTSGGANWIVTEPFAHDVDIDYSVLPYQATARTIIQELDQQNDWFLKDPRLCLTLPFWMPHIKDPVIILVNRNPLSVATSLSRRGDCSIPEGIALWERYTRTMLKHSHGYKRILIQFESMMQNPQAEYDRIMNWLEQQGSHRLQRLSIHDLNSWFEKDMVHHFPHPVDIMHDAPASVSHLYEQLKHDHDLTQIYDTVLSPGSYQSLRSFERSSRLELRLRNQSRYWKIRMLDVTARQSTNLHQHRLIIEALLQSWRWKFSMGLLEHTPWKAHRDGNGYDISLLRQTARSATEHLDAETAMIRTIAPDLNIKFPDFPHEMVADGPAYPVGKPLRTIMSEVGNNASGDEAIYLASAKRLLDAGHTVNWLVRVSQTSALQECGLPIKEYFLPIDIQFPDHIQTALALLDEMRNRLPESMTRLESVLADHDVLLIAPGGRYIDGYCNRRALLAAALAQRLGIPVIMLHQSFGPFSRETDRNLIREILSGCELIVVRDDISMKLLLSMNVPAEILFLSRDVIFAEKYNPPAEIRYDLGINFRFGFNGHATKSGLELLIRAYQRHFPDHRILLYTTTHALPNEIQESARVLGIDFDFKQLQYPDYLMNPGCCRLNVTDSYHGAVFSMLAKQPFICCQPDFQSTKFQGTSIPGSFFIDPLECPVTEDQVEKIMDAIHQHYANPTLLSSRFGTLRMYGQHMAEMGWEKVNIALNHISNQATK